MQFLYKIPGYVLLLFGGFCLSWGGFIVRSFQEADVCLWLSNSYEKLIQPGADFHRFMTIMSASIRTSNINVFQAKSLVNYSVLKRKLVKFLGLAAFLKQVSRPNLAF